MYVTVDNELPHCVVENRGVRRFGYYGPFGLYKFGACTYLYQLCSLTLCVSLSQGYLKRAKSISRESN